MAKTPEPFLSVRGHQFEKYSFEKNAFKGSNTITVTAITAICHIFYSIFGCNLCKKKKIQLLNQLHGMNPLRDIFDIILHEPESFSHFCLIIKQYLFPFQQLSF